MGSNSTSGTCSIEPESLPPLRGYGWFFGIPTRGRRSFVALAPGYNLLAPPGPDVCPMFLAAKLARLRIETVPEAFASF